MLKLIVTISLLITTQAFALPTPFVSKGEELMRADYNFNGIAKTASCSASVVKFRNDTDDNSAKLLTNGHCMGLGSRVVFGHKMPAPGEVFVNTKTNLSVQLLSDDGKSNVGTVMGEKLLYGTMTDTDMALYQLNKTYKQIKAEFNVSPLVLADRPAIQGTAINIVSGYWRKGYSCSLAAYVYRLKEDAWTFKDSLRYSEDGCKIIGGTSGSPVISETSREVIGVNNTVNENGQKCALNNPCEENERGDISIYTKGGYGQHTDWLYTCLNSRNEIDLSVGGCVLPKPQN